jgi:hypothetical protein
MKTATSRTGWRFHDNINIYLGERGCRNRTWFRIVPSDGTGFSISGVQNLRALVSCTLSCARHKIVCTSCKNCCGADFLRG